MHLTETNSFHKLTNNRTSPLEDVYLKTSGSEVYTAATKTDKSPLTLKRYKHLFNK
jgi:hypothetical protein